MAVRAIWSGDPRQIECAVSVRGFGLPGEGGRQDDDRPRTETRALFGGAEPERSGKHLDDLIGRPADLPTARLILDFDYVSVPVQLMLAASAGKIEYPG